MEQPGLLLGWQRFWKDSITVRQDETMLINNFKENEANCEYFLVCMLLIKLRVGLGCEEQEMCGIYFCL